MRALVIIALACLIASPGQASTRKSKADTAQAAPATAANDAKLADFSLGKLVLGTGSLADAKDKGVVIEAWGVNCPPCIASLPHLQELSVKHKDKVLFFGAECQMSEKKAIEAVIAKAGVTYPIFSGFKKCPIQLSGIPHAFVFDSTGKMLFQGSPYDKGFNAAIETAAATAKPGAKPKA